MRTTGVLITLALLVVAATLASANKLAAAPAPPNVRCYEVSPAGKHWSRTPELLCVARAVGSTYRITLQTGHFNAKQVGQLDLDLLQRVRCIDCNKDVFGLSNPSNSVFNKLQIAFDGKRDVKARTESGTVTIGATKLYYRLYSGKRPSVAPGPGAPPAAPTKKVKKGNAVKKAAKK